MERITETLDHDTEPPPSVSPESMTETLGQSDAEPPPSVSPKRMKELLDQSDTEPPLSVSFKRIKERLDQSDTEPPTSVSPERMTETLDQSDTEPPPIVSPKRIKGALDQSDTKPRPSISPKRSTETLGQSGRAPLPRISPERITDTLDQSNTELPPSVSPTVITFFKVIIVGGPSVGKTSLAYRYIKGEFCEYPSSVIGCIFFKRTVELGETRIRFDIWETAGEERYACMAPFYYHGSDAAIVVYDVTDNKSFQRAKWWVKEVRRNTNADILIALAGNKADLVSEREVGYTKAETYARRNGLLFMETSAKTEMNVKEIFLTLAAKRPTIDREEQNGLVLHRSNSENESPRRCCIS